MKTASTSRAMRRTKSEEALLTEDQVAWFKWEFLRRNENYQKDFAAFEARFGKWFQENGYWWSRTGPPYNRHAWFFFCTQIAPIAKEICKRWGVSQPFDPSWTFNAIGVRIERGSRVTIPFFTSSDDHPEWDLKAVDPALLPTEEEETNELLKGVPAMIGAETPSGNTNDRRFIRIEIDVTKPIEASIAEVLRRIELARDLYEAHVGRLPDHRRKPRLRLDQYGIYLKAWDLRKQGKTFEQIARKVFPREMENAIQSSSGVDKARSNYKRASELVSGGYRQIEA